jgi:hypothetical protein
VCTNTGKDGEEEDEVGARAAELGGEPVIPLVLLELLLQDEPR